MIKYYLIFAFLVASCNGSAQGVIDWAYNMGSTQADFCTQASLDDQGSLFITGVGGTQSSMSTAFNGFVAKYDGNGNMIWERSIVNGQSFSLSMGKDGSFYITGKFVDTAYFGSTPLYSNGNYDYFLAKYDTYGSLVWVKNGGASDIYGSDASYDIEVDDSQNVIITGQGANDSVGFFVSKYSSQGNLLWTSTTDPARGFYGFSLDSDTDGVIYCAGEFNDNFILNGEFVNAVGGACFFVSKYDSSGNVTWLRPRDSLFYGTPSEVVVHPRGGCVVTGNIDPPRKGGEEIYVFRYDENGNLLWRQHIGDGNKERSECLAIDNSLNIYIGGHSGGDSITRDRSTRATIYKLDSNGNFLWKYSKPSDADIPRGYPNSVNGMCIKDEKLYFSGGFKGILDLTPVKLTPIGNADAFLARMDLNHFFKAPTIRSTELFQVFPNPVSEKLNLDFITPGDYTINLLDTKGVVIKTSYCYSCKNAEFTIHDLPAGAYNLKVKGKSEVEVRKIIVQ